MKNKKKLIALVLGFIAIAIIAGFVKKSKSSQDIKPMETVELRKKDIENTISTSGVVVSEEKVNVFTNINVPVKEVLVSLGDRVKKGDVLAVLDTSSLENDLKQSKLTYKGSLEALSEQKKDSQGNIVNAANSLKASEIALSQQELQTKALEETLKELNFKKPMDTRAMDKNIEELELALKNKEIDLNRLYKEEKSKKEALDKFDDSGFKEEALEKSRALTRKREELKSVEREIGNLRGRSKTFDSYSYTNALEDSERDYSRKQEELELLEEKLKDLKANQGDESLELIGETENQIRAMKLELTDLSRLVKRNKEALKRAENDFYRAEDDLRETSLKEAHANLQRLKYELEDLERDYKSIDKRMDKAKLDGLKASLEDYEKIRSTVKDAEYELILARNSHEKSLLDKEKAMEDYIDNNKKELSQAKRNFLDSKKQLEASKNSLDSSRNNLSQAKNKTSSDVSVDINKLNLEKIESQIENGRVIATSDGVVTEIKAEVGALTNDILFVIEDLDNVYIKSKIKEHSLGLVDLNQKVNISTVATGDQVFPGSLTYIADRALSQGGPAVEFEIFAKPSQKDPKIKVGMNSFLNIVTDSRKNVFVLPLNALVNEGGRNYIYTDENEKIEVELGISNRSEVEVKSKDLREGLIIRTDMNLETEGASYEG